MEWITLLLLLLLLLCFGGKVVQLVFKHKMFVTLIVLDVAAVLSTIEKYDKRICCYVIVTFLDVSIYYLLHMNPEEG
jgi:hypothetical protein